LGWHEGLERNVDIEALLAQATPQEQIVRICLRGDLRSEWEQLEHDLQTASTEGVSLGDIAPATQIARKMEDLRAQMESATVPFRLRALHPIEWSKFYDTRPRKDKDQTEDDWSPIWHAWLCQMVAISCVEPAMTAEQVDRLMAKLSNRQWLDLADTAWNLNAEREQVPFSVAASALISIDGEKSRRPDQPASPGPASSAGNHAKPPRTRTTKKAASPKR
jgi:hypothetical protein